ncbi:MAG: HAD family hydrolase [Pseudomonas sp.]|uniref:HAD family hydrolase n=1 Tax=Pseudomonas sp. TaxID=306 RepID=UPI000730838E|nr:haloacid dehalogenase [Pseudomonas sp. ABAC61]
MTIRAVVFDFGGVLFDWSPHHLYRQLIPDDQHRQWFLDTICTQAWNTRQDAGRTLAEATRSLVAEHPEHRLLIEAYYGRWIEMLRGQLDDGVALLEDLHQAQMPLFGLTNWSRETFPHAWDNYPFLQRFRDIVVSGQERLIKPDAPIYHTTVQRIRAHLPDIAPGELAFIDDHEPNIIAARALGWHAIHHLNAQQTREQLQALGITL